MNVLGAEAVCGLAWGSLLSRGTQDTPFTIAPLLNSWLSGSYSREAGCSGQCMLWACLPFFFFLLQQHLLLSANRLLFSYSLPFLSQDACSLGDLRRDGALRAPPRGPRKVKVTHAEKVSEDTTFAQRKA